jgi:hypothetical protein
MSHRVGARDPEACKLNRTPLSERRRGKKGDKWPTPSRLDPLSGSRATSRRNHHRLARDMTGRGLTNRSTIKNSQIIGHVQGWMVGIPTRAKESQKAQQRVAKAMQGIYNKPSLRLLYASMSPLVMHLKVLPMIKKCSSIQLCVLSRTIRYRGEVTGLLTEDENVVDPRSIPNKDI